MAGQRSTVRSKDDQAAKKLRKLSARINSSTKPVSSETKEVIEAWYAHRLAQHQSKHTITLAAY
jgi:hypothetical protein